MVCPPTPKRSLALLLLALVFTGPLGCKPKFTDDQCSKDEDCFESEICNANGLCEAKPPPEKNPTVVSFTASDEGVRVGETITLSWTLEDAESASITADVGGLDYRIPFASRESGTLDVTIEEAKTYTFTITVTAQEKTDTKTVQVTGADIDKPTIVEFIADPETITEGQSTLLKWRSTDAESGKITGGESDIVLTADQLTSGQVSVQPTAPTSYTLELTNIVGTTTQSVSVNVQGQRPVIDEFTTSAETVKLGDTVTLSWKVGGATAIEISDNAANKLDLTGKNPAGDSIDITIDRPATTYTLKASNDAGDVFDTVMVSALAEMKINEFKATPQFFSAGAEVTLSWAISGVPDALTLVDDGGAMVDLTGVSKTAGNVKITPTAETTYTLTATNALETDTATVKVSPLPDPPTINTFTISSSAVNPGDMVTLSWSTTGADAITITDGDANMIDVSMKNRDSDSVAVTVNQSTTYTITASNPGGGVTAAVTVSVGNIVAITSFTSDKATALAGDDVVLSWATVNASSLSITGSDGSTIDLAGKSVAMDSVTVTPGADITYTLSADGFAGPVTQTVMITVSPRATISVFQANPSVLASGGSSTLSWDTSATTALTLEQVVNGMTTMVDISGKNRDSDTLTVSPTEDTTYRLTATGANMDSVTSEVTVTVYTPASVTSFMADRTMVTAGEAVTLVWAATDATNVVVFDSFGQPVSGAMANPSGGTITVRPQVTTTYTVIVGGAQGSQDQQQVTVTVAAADLLITEVFLDATGADDGLEWVEIVNNGNTFVDLKHYSIGAGTANYTDTTQQLAGILAPGQCAVIGGPTRVGTNGNPTYFLERNFAPDLPNGGTTAHGVGLFFSTNLSSASVPIDAVVFGDANTNGLLGEGGAAKTDLSPSPISNRSLERVSLDDDVFRVQATPNPGRCFDIAALVTTSAPNEASGEVVFKGYGIDPALFEIKLGAQGPLTCTVKSRGVYGCTVSSTMTTGAVALEAKLVNEYIEDAQGDPTPIALPGTSQKTVTVANAFTWEARLSDGAVNSFFCGIVDPMSPFTGAAGATFNVDAEIYLAGSTESNGDVPASYVIQAAVQSANGTSYQNFLSWVTASKTGNNGSNAVYTAPITSATVMTGEVAYRVSPDNGASFYYCDRSAMFSGSDDDWTVGGGLPVTWQ